MAIENESENGKAQENLQQNIIFTTFLRWQVGLGKLKAQE
jgi:hypothetical protein